eukprot:CAMPEP_0185796954 /NCGR_PEP_ID=MMETSP1174-20130828/161356_1 /TAXON_ID=35687 /ORGANISM="Dictyocha speculum, Strain CCMP1381" /LENGTH=291 /DNA_ID=CAMNT_0028492349 /DNA_START=1019 /DNA_END=1891 /DNA_ORIENTATION=+
MESSRCQETRTRTAATAHPTPLDDDVTNIIDDSEWFYDTLRDAQNQRWADGRVKRGVQHAKEGRPDDALKAYEQALGMWPKHVDALVARGALLANRGELKRAAVDLERALAIDPGAANAESFLEMVRRSLARQPRQHSSSTSGSIRSTADMAMARQSDRMSSPLNDGQNRRQDSGHNYRNSSTSSPRQSRKTDRGVGHESSEKRSNRNHTHRHRRQRSNSPVGYGTVGYGTVALETENLAAAASNKEEDEWLRDLRRQGSVPSSSSRSGPGPVAISEESLRDLLKSDSEGR